MDNIFRIIPMNVLIALWDNGGEVTLNDLCCNKIKEYLKDYPGYKLLIRKTIARYTIPDGIITKDDQNIAMLEFKKNSTLEAVKGALCQMLCYVARSVGHGVVPYRHLVVWNPEKVYLFSWERIELLYENFLLYYKNETPSTYWEHAPKAIKGLFEDIDQLYTDVLDLQTLDMNQLIDKIAS